MMLLLLLVLVNRSCLIDYRGHHGVLDRLVNLLVDGGAICGHIYNPFILLGVINAWQGGGLEHFAGEDRVRFFSFHVRNQALFC